MRTPSVVEREVLRVGVQEREPRSDQVLVEEPLELRVLGDTVAVTMRTPGRDRELAAGFLFSEGIIASREDLGTLTHCGRPGDEGFGNTLEVTPASGVPFDPDRLRLSRRGTITTAACGVCGRASVEDLVKISGRVRFERDPLPAQRIREAPEQLRAQQATFSTTGGSHAAAILGRDGAVLAFDEDIGRHNAVDKVVGALLLRGTLARSQPSPGVLLVVSGRASFEIVQKAAMARIPIVASVSAPSSLAITLAEHTGITLAGFVRGASFNVYTHPARIGP